MGSEMCIRDSRWMSRFFNYLDRYYIARHSFASLKDVGMMCFREEVYKTLAGAMKDATLTLVASRRVVRWWGGMLPLQPMRDCSAS